MANPLWALVLSISAFLLPAGVGADTLKLRNGDVLTGDISGETVTLRAPDRGDLVIPVASIASMRFRSGEEVAVGLIDGTEIVGTIAAERILVDQGLYSRSIPVGDITAISIERRTASATLPKGTPMKMMLAEWLRSQSVEPGQRVRFCVSEDVPMAGKVVIDRGSPGVGEITAARGAGHVSQQGEIELEPRYVLGPSGGHVPIGGAAGEYKGGLDAGAFVMGGVLGFLASGEEAQVPPGQVFDVETLTDTQLPAGNVGVSQQDIEARRHCETFFRFSDVEVVPLEEVDLNAVYAPFATALVASMPLSELGALEDGAHLDRSLRNLLTYDTYIQAMSLSVDRGRKSVKIPIRFVITVLPSHDKRLDLKLTVVDGDDVLASAEERNIDAEEEKSKLAQLTLSLERSRFEKAFASGNPRLRIELKVRE